MKFSDFMQEVREAASASCAANEVGESVLTESPENSKKIADLEERLFSLCDDLGFVEIMVRVVACHDEQIVKEIAQEIGKNNPEWMDFSS